MSGEDSSTRTIASVAAVIGILALALGLIDSIRTGTLAEYAFTADAVSQSNERALKSDLDAVVTRLEALEAQAAAGGEEAPGGRFAPSPKTESRSRTAGSWIPAECQLDASCIGSRT